MLIKVSGAVLTIIVTVLSYQHGGHATDTLDDTEYKILKLGIKSGSVEPIELKKSIHGSFTPCGYPINGNITKEDPDFAHLSSTKSNNQSDNFESIVVPEDKNSSNQRQKVLCSNTWPYQIHGLIVSKFKGNCSKEILVYGTGTLISPYHVLTVGHNVYPHHLEEKCITISGRWPETVSFTPGLDGAYQDNHKNQKPSGECEVVMLWSFKNWIQKQDITFDIALITLSEPIGRQLGWASLLSLPDKSLEGYEITSMGYCIDYPKGCCPNAAAYSQMVEMSNQITEVGDCYIWHNINTTKGQSGSSISCTYNYIYKKIICALGIHNLGENLTTRKKNNHAVRLCDQKITKISEWINQDFNKLSQEERDKIDKRREFNELKNKQSTSIEEKLKLAKWYEEGVITPRDIKQAMSSYQAIINFNSEELQVDQELFITRKLCYHLYELKQYKVTSENCEKYLNLFKYSNKSAAQKRELSSMHQFLKNILESSVISDQSTKIEMEKLAGKYLKAINSSSENNET